MGSSWPELAEDRERDFLLGYLEKRFGIPSERFDGYLLFKRKQAWIVLKCSQQIELASSYRVEKAGLKALRKVSRYIKPTTRFMQLFGDSATRAKVEINKKQLQSLMEGEDLSIQMDIEKGYVVLSLDDGGVIGIGFYSDGRIRSQLPKRNRFVLNE